MSSTLHTISTTIAGEFADLLDVPSWCCAWRWLRCWADGWVGSVNRRAKQPGCTPT